LPPEEKRLLQTAAVIGTDVPFALLQGIADVPEEALHRGLAHLQAVEFLYETRLFPEQEYTFMHALTHEVAYGSLLQVQRRALHVRIVEAIEAPERGAEQVERLAHHALRGEVWDKAVTYYQQAGARAHDAPRSARRWPHSSRRSRPSSTCMRTATPGRWPLSSASPWEACCSALGEYGRCLALLGEAEVLARELDDRPRTVRVLSRLTQVLRITGDLDGAIARGQQVYELAAMLGENVLQMRASFILGEIYYVIGDFRRAGRAAAAEREGDRPGV
jgi:tetratricopeptide (TPR) repeat protein